MNDNFPKEHHEDMVRNKRYGRLVIHYVNGEVQLVTKEETIKPYSGPAVATAGGGK